MSLFLDCGSVLECYRDIEAELLAFVSGNLAVLLHGNPSVLVGVGHLNRTRDLLGQLLVALRNRDDAVLDRYAFDRFGCVRPDYVAIAYLDIVTGIFACELGQNARFVECVAVNIDCNYRSVSRSGGGCGSL